jgi:hypothetical protein
MSKFLHALTALAVVATALADENPPYEGPPIPMSVLAICVIHLGTQMN